MSCHQSHPCNSSCPCPPLGPLVNQPCPAPIFKCPVVCVPGTFATDDLSVNDQLFMMIVTSILQIFEDPTSLCSTCDSSAPQLVCVDRCSIPFTGQEVTTIKLNLDTIDPGLSLGVVTINVYEKCNTLWFKIPCQALYDPALCNDPTIVTPATVGSVSITKSVGCPQEWTGRILLDGICYPISFKIKQNTELIAQCGCPPYLQYTYDLVVESSFQKFFHTQSITCLDATIGGTLISTALFVQVKALFFEYVLTQLSGIKEKYDCGSCAIGPSCSGATTSCWSSSA